jgi:hypothetical protein
MKLITLEQAKQHLRVDGDAENALIEVYANAAERLVAEYANRNLYPNAGALVTALGSISANVNEAYANYDVARLAADSVTHPGERDFARGAAVMELDMRMAEARRTRHGIVATDDIIAAILLTLGTLYGNREDVSEASAREIPLNARWIMDNHRMLAR